MLCPPLCLTASVPILKHGGQLDVWLCRYYHLHALRFGYVKPSSSPPAPSLCLLVCLQVSRIVSLEYQCEVEKIFTSAELLNSPQQTPENGEN